VEITIEQFVVRTATLKKRQDVPLPGHGAPPLGPNDHPVREKAARWTRLDDDLLRFLFDSGCTIDLVAETLDRRPEDMGRRGYVLGLPSKWFKRATA
jgi:hypothetical protein